MPVDRRCVYCERPSHSMNVGNPGGPVPKSEWEQMVDCLEELYALVKGECPSLLNEDSGGDAQLDIRIQDVLARVKADYRTDPCNRPENMR